MADPAAPHVERSRFRVRYAETDQMGVVYHANYLVWCEVGRTDYIRRFGTTYAKLETQGIRLAVTEAALRYHAGATYDDPIVVETRLVSVRSRSIVFSYEIRHETTGKLLVSASTTLMSLGADGRPAALREDVRAALAASMGAAA
jgi:acyl-CoA thioester hydrolase